MLAKTKLLFAAILALGVSYYFLETLVDLQAKNRLEQEQLVKKPNIEIVDENFCPYEHRPYKNIEIDTISPEISTDIDASMDELLADLTIIDDTYIDEVEKAIIPLPKSIGKTKIPTPTIDKIVIPRNTYKIAIVIDDMGIASKRTKDILSIKAPITSSFLTYAKELNKYFELAKQSGHEVIAHIPMEAKIQKNVAPDCLLLSMPNRKLNKSFKEMLSKFSDIKGLNNHTGSLFTENEEKIKVIFKTLAKNNLYFLDSKTSQNSIAKKVADELGVKYLSRNVFLDNENDFAYISNQLILTEKIARKKGYAIAIGHPKSQTFAALKNWVEKTKSSDIEIVHLNSLIK